MPFETQSIQVPVSQPNVLTYPSEKHDGAPEAPFPFIYQKYAVHTVRKMVGLVEAVRRLKQGSVGNGLDKYSNFFFALQYNGLKSHNYGNFIRSYPSWLIKDLHSVWTEPACWQPNGRKNSLSVEGRLALSVVEAKIAGRVPAHQAVLQGNVVTGYNAFHNTTTKQGLGPLFG